MLMHHQLCELDAKQQNLKKGTIWQVGKNVLNKHKDDGFDEMKYFL